jgi:hypothetical protein
VDSTRPALATSFTENTFTAMIEGIAHRAIAAGIIDADTMRRGIAALRRTTRPDGMFGYTFFKATAVAA